jgi:uncharacterized protein (DUF885 family)
VPRVRAVFVAVIGFFLAGAPSPGAPAGSWNALADDFVDQLFRFLPSQATSAGVHSRDAELEDFSRAGMEKQVAALRRFEQRVLAFDPRGLGPVDSADREMLLASIRGSLLSIREVRAWERDPNTYLSGAAQSVYVIMSRSFASPDARLRPVIARERQFPRYFADARANLRGVPRIYTEIALEQLPGTIGFFERDVPAAFAGATDAGLRADFALANAAAVDTLREFERWLERELLPRSNGDFRIGAETFRKKLLYDEMVSTPLDRLLEIGLADLRRNQAEFERVAKEVDSSKSTKEVLADLGSLHPAPGELLEAFRSSFGALVSFIRSHRIITLPEDRRPILEETPPFERATTTASLDSPGPFEETATEAYFNVTLPGPEDSREEIASLMAGFNVGTIVSTSVHEAFPGHFTQFLWEKRAPTKLRRVLAANSNVEGWAHYAEQMMLDEGYGQPGAGASDLRESRLIRLGQLQDALLRDARFVVGIEMHRGKFSFEEGKEFFVREGYQSARIAEIETKRGTQDPTYLYYTLGKLQILKLREDLRRKQGAGFSLGKFHDDFMSQGYPPIAIVRRALLGDRSPTL